MTSEVIIEFIRSDEGDIKLEEAIELCKKSLKQVSVYEREELKEK